MELVETKHIGALGRVVIPENARTHLGLETGVEINMYIDGPALVILPSSVHVNACAVCGTTCTSLDIKVLSRNVCATCVDRINQAAT